MHPIEELLSLCGKDPDYWEGDTEDLCNLAINKIKELKESMEKLICPVCEGTETIPHWQFDGEKRVLKIIPCPECTRFKYV